MNPSHEPFLGPRPPARSHLLGVAYDRLTLADVMARIRRVCVERTSLHIVTVNVNFVTLARREPLFARVIENSDCAVADGRILQLATLLLGEPAPEQITGHDLVRECVSLAHERRYGVFLLGAPPGVAAGLARRLERDYPGLRAAGTDHGIFHRDGTTLRQAELVRAIRDFRPEFLFLGLGAPKQELWLSRHLEEVEVPVGIGVGAVLDVMAGRLTRAPRWAQKAGLESAFRIVTSPRRYARRYLVDDVPTVLRLAHFIAQRRLLSDYADP